jgi:TonB family protein
MARFEAAEVSMAVRHIGTLLALVSAVPLSAQPADEAAARNSANWEIFQKLYPPRAIAAREEGAVGFKVTLDSQGQVTRCEVTHSSGHPLLDNETCVLVTMHAQFKPEGTGSPSQERTREGMIAWKLPASTTVLAPPKAVTPASAPEKIVCKKFIRVGTLSGFERTCMTEREWATQRENMKQPWDELQGRKGSSRGPCMDPAGC